MEKEIKSIVDSYLYSWEYAVIRGEQAYNNVIQDKYEEGMTTLLNRLLYKKYHIDAADWLSTLTVKQLDVVSDCILECSTFDALKEKVGK